MSSKKDPTEPSYFVPNILKPLQLFFEADGLGEGLKSRFGRRWTEEVFKAVVTRSVVTSTILLVSNVRILIPNHPRISFLLLLFHDTTRHDT